MSYYHTSKLLGGMLEPVILATKLVKEYGDVLAVGGIDLPIHQREVFGFLGPNGAGKTTTMKMIPCVSPVTSGEVSVSGKSVKRDPRGVKALLGVVPQEENLDADLTVLKNLVTHARYYDIDSTTAVSRAWEALFLFQLEEKAHSRIDTLSGGMKRLLLVAWALID